MRVLVVDLQNSTFEHEVFNTGLLEALTGVASSVEVIGSTELRSYYQREFPQLMLRVKWRGNRQEKHKDFSPFGAWRLFKNLERQVTGADEVILYTSTTPSILMASWLLARSLSRKQGSRKFFFVFHGMLANLESSLALRPSPWFRLSRRWIPTIYPTRLVFSLPATLALVQRVSGKYGFNFGFLTTKSRDKFSSLFPRLQNHAFFLPIRICSELEVFAIEPDMTKKETSPLTLGILGWHNSNEIEDIVRKNPGVNFIFLGPKGANASNSENTGRHLSRAEMKAVAVNIDVFLLARNSPPSNWSLSGIPSEMLVYGKRLIVPDGMSIGHYGLDEGITIFMSEVFDESHKIRSSALLEIGTKLNAEFIRRSRRNLDAQVKTTLLEALS
jgi:hypothetical protein